MKAMSNDEKLVFSIKNAEQAIALCLCNKFKQAEDFLKPLDHELLYHNLSQATIAYLQAILTYEPEYIERAYSRVKDALTICDKYRKKHSWSETIQSWVGRVNLEDFTEVQLHAELCYAECLLERALLTFIQDENLISFIKGGLKIRSAYNMYRTCLQVLEHNPKVLRDSKTKVHYDTGVFMGVGSFNLLLSLLPARVLRLLEWVGFSGDREKGMQWLNKGYEMDGLRSAMCTITILTYQIVVSPLLGTDDTDIPYCEKLLKNYLHRFPNSSIFLYFSGRLKQTQGELHAALEEYKQSVSVNIDWMQIHHICYWEMMWCHGFLGEWEEAAKHAGKLSLESKWSKASYMYIEAAFLIMQHFEWELSGNKDEDLHKTMNDIKEKYDDILREIPKHKQRIAGKSIPFEKFAVSRVQKYESTNQLILPALELFHIWNGYTMFKDHTDILKKYLVLVDKAEANLDESKYDDKRCYHDDVCLCKLIRGICLRHLKRTDDAEKLLIEVSNSHPSWYSCKMDCYLPPYASCELGFLYKELGESEKAMSQLQHTLKSYSKYGLESRLHFRIHSGIESLKHIKEGTVSNHIEDNTSKSMTNHSNDLPPDIIRPESPPENKGAENILDGEKDCFLDKKKDYEAAGDNVKNVSEGTANITLSPTTSSDEDFFDVDDSLVHQTTAISDMPEKTEPVTSIQTKLNSPQVSRAGLISAASANISPRHISRKIDQTADTKVSMETYV